MPLPWLIPAIATAANLAGTFIGQGMQRRENRRARRYNSPKAQMQRYRDAGLNPNLIYSQGTPGNYGTPIDYQQFGNVGSSFIEASQTSAQTELTQQKTQESVSKTDLIDAQEDLVRANPFLDPEYLANFVEKGIADSQIKRQERDYKLSIDAEGFENGIRKMQTEVDLLMQRYQLGEADKKIKAQVFQSKEFQNELQRIQLNWMKDGDITPQHIYQGIMMVLMKLM